MLDSTLKSRGHKKVASKCQEVGVECWTSTVEIPIPLQKAIHRRIDLSRRSTAWRGDICLHANTTRTEA